MICFECLSGEVHQGGKVINHFLTTGDPEAFRALGRRFLQLPIAAVERVDVAALARAAA